MQDFNWRPRNHDYKWPVVSDRLYRWNIQRHWTLQRHLDLLWRTIFLVWLFTLNVRVFSGEFWPMRKTTNGSRKQMRNWTRRRRGEEQVTQRIDCWMCRRREVAWLYAALAQMMEAESILQNGQRPVCTRRHFYNRFFYLEADDQNRRYIIWLMQPPEIGRNMSSRHIIRMWSYAYEVTAQP